MLDFFYIFSINFSSNCHLKGILTYIFCILALSAEGFGDRIETYALISGLITSLYSAGAFIGPSVGGALVQSLAFRKASIFPLSIETTVLCLIILNYIWKKEELFSSRSGYQYID